MSFTFIHRKGGKEIPVKLSLLDAVLGRPPSWRPKPKAAPEPEVKKPIKVWCRKCKSVHYEFSGRVYSTIKECREKTPAVCVATAAKDEEGSISDTKNEESVPPFDCTEEQIKTIIEMKSRKKVPPWKEILMEIGKDTEVKDIEGIKAYWKSTLESRAVSEKIDDEKAEKVEAPTEKPEAKSNENQTQNEKSKKQKKQEKCGRTEGKTETPKSAGLSRDDVAHWIEVASRHFDKTGKRISPQVAKEMELEC